MAGRVQGGACTSLSLEAKGATGSRLFSDSRAPSLPSERSEGPCPLPALSHHPWSRVSPAGLPYLAGEGSCHLGGFRELWQAGCGRATFVPTPLL